MYLGPDPPQKIHLNPLAVADTLFLATKHQRSNLRGLLLLLNAVPNPAIVFHNTTPLPWQWIAPGPPFTRRFPIVSSSAPLSRALRELSQAQRFRSLKQRLFLIVLRALLPILFYLLPCVMTEIL